MLFIVLVKIENREVNEKRKRHEKKKKKNDIETVGEK